MITAHFYHTFLRSMNGNDAENKSFNWLECLLINKRKITNSQFAIDFSPDLLSSHWFFCLLFFVSSFCRRSFFNEHHNDNFMSQYSPLSTSTMKKKIAPFINFDKLNFLTLLWAIMFTMSAALPENSVISSPTNFHSTSLSLSPMLKGRPHYRTCCHDTRNTKQEQHALPVIIPSIFCYQTASGIKVN